MNTVKREEKNAQFNGRKERWVSIIVADALKIVTIKRTSTKLVRKQVLLTRVWKGIFEIRDLTVPWEAGLAKNWAQDAGFMFA